MWGSRIPSSSSRWAGKALSLVLLVASPILADEAPVPLWLDVREPCQSAETWLWPESFRTPATASFRAALADPDTRPEAALRLFAEADLLSTGNERVWVYLAEYARGRSLLQAELPDLAARYFDQLFAYPPTRDTAPVQLAAMACLQAIQDRHLGILISDRALLQVPSYWWGGFSPKSALPTLQRATFDWLLLTLAQGGKPEAVLKPLAALRGSGPYEQLGQGLVFVTQKRIPEAIPHLARFVGNEKLPPALERRRNPTRLLLGRMYYNETKFAEAVRELDLIDKRSNELVHALSLLSSAHLIREEPSRAIGIAVSLRSGPMRKTFCPEALMAAAIALNELCQFPESLAILNTFKKEYREVYRWLRREQSTKRAPGALYGQAVSALAAKPTTVPDAVMGEWLRLPGFLSRQDRINRLFAEKRTIAARLKDAPEFIAAEELALEAFKKEQQEELKSLRKRKDPTPEQRQEIRARVALVKNREAAQARLEKALPHFKKVLEMAGNQAPGLRSGLVARIEREFERVNSRIFKELISVVENTELIEAEIWNGASQDLVWQNAHPDFDEMVKTKKIRSDRQVASSAEDVYDWGTSTSGLSGGDEVWEDELGALQANLQNNCANKEKYMKLKRRR